MQLVHNKELTPAAQGRAGERLRALIRGRAINAANATFTAGKLPAQQVKNAPVNNY